MTLYELLTTDRAVITVTECAQVLECDPRTVSAAIAAGNLPAVRLGRTLRIPVAKLLPLLTDGPQTEDEPGALTPGTAPTIEPAEERAHGSHDDSTSPGLRGVA